MLTHVITEADLADYIEDHRNVWVQYACSSSASGVKKLEFRLRCIAPLYKVSLQGRDIYIGAVQETAVREYNALP